MGPRVEDTQTCDIIFGNVATVAVATAVAVIMVVAVAVIMAMAAAVAVAVAAVAMLVPAPRARPAADVTRKPTRRVTLSGRAAARTGTIYRRHTTKCQDTADILHRSCQTASHTPARD